MTSASAAAGPRPWNRQLNFTLFWASHIVCLAAIFTGVHARDLLICAILYFVRMFGVTAGYHRYFSHRSYKMSRIPQFLMALLATTSSQKGVLWWAAKHRHHHKHSDQDEDLHSPARDGFWYSHVGWILNRDHEKTDHSAVKDFAKYPELVWLDRLFVIPVIALGTAIWWFFGWSGLVVGFFWSTVLLWHGTFLINSLAHVFGTRRYQTTDDSRNSIWLALLTLGEGWHNNHHYYQSSTRQGFRWWEIDVTYYILRMMSWVGLVRGIREPPDYIVYPELGEKRRAAGLAKQVAAKAVKSEHLAA